MGIKSSMTRSLKISIMAIFSMALITAGVAGCKSDQKPPSESATKFFSTDKPSAGAGQSIFKSNCSTCHGSNGAGDGPAAAKLKNKPVNFTDTKSMRGKEPQGLFEALTNGRKCMPGFKKSLTARQRWNVLFFTWSRVTSPMQIAAGKNVYTKNCLPCHGRRGDGHGPRAAGRKIDPPDFNDQRYMMKEDSNRFFKVLTNGENPMPSYKKTLTDDQRWSAIDYIWTFVYKPPVE